MSIQLYAGTHRWQHWFHSSTYPDHDFQTIHSFHSDLVKLSLVASTMQCLEWFNAFQEISQEGNFAVCCNYAMYYDGRICCCCCWCCTRAIYFPIVKPRAGKRFIALTNGRAISERIHFGKESSRQRLWTFMHLIIWTSGYGRSRMGEWFCWFYFSTAAVLWGPIWVWLGLLERHGLPPHRLRTRSELLLCYVCGKKAVRFIDGRCFRWFEWYRLHCCGIWTEIGNCCF